MARQPPRSNRRRNGRLIRTYREPDSESEIDFESVNPDHRPIRSSRRTQTYCEDNTTDEDDSSADFSSNVDVEVEPTSLPDLQNETQPAGGTQGCRSLRRSQRTLDKSSSRKHIFSSISLRSFKRRKTNQSTRVVTKSTKAIADDAESIPVNIHAPPWQILEYNILLKIMQYASYPLYSSAFRSRPSIEWLRDVSRLCKGFHDAATAALLWEPPVTPNFRANDLLSMLGQDQERLMSNYRTKVRSLNIEVRHILVRNIENLLKHTPLLKHLRIFHRYDEMVGKAIWAEPRMGQFKWSYGNIFHHLDENNIRLKSFEWNGRFHDTIPIMLLAHQKQCMRDVEEISIVNMVFGDKQEEERTCARDYVVPTIASLRQLRKLTFHNCNILDSTAMAQLPIGLESLKFVNCLSLTSEGVGSYLALGGSTLRSLHLEGNQVMDLGFMPFLSETCSRMENLYVDLSYEDSSSYSDRNPLYDELLPNGSPTWPSSLNSIVVGPLRSLDVSEAEGFYKSLINAADNLPFLRVLCIRSILNDASWRDRAELRKKWRPLFEKVFAANKTYISPTNESKQEESIKGPQRRSARIQELEDPNLSDDSSKSPELIPGLPVCPRQNRCEIVEFYLSDQRPAPEQFREADFLDSEPSDDDEWNGTDQAAADNSYAW